MKTPAYPPIPRNHVPRKEARRSAPERPGIYFVWNDGVVTYVGQSVNVRQRICSNHVGAGSRVSWVTVHPEILYYAEAHYIGRLQPVDNFGKSKFRSTSKSQGFDGDYDIGPPETGIHQASTIEEVAEFLPHLEDPDDPQWEDVPEWHLERLGELGEAMERGDAAGIEDCAIDYDDAQID